MYFIFSGEPVVKFLCGKKYSVKQEKWIVKTANGSTVIRKQIPLRLAWAFSIHKSQVKLLLKLLNLEM